MTKERDEEEDGNKEGDDEDRRTERVVDEGPHSWMVQGDGEDGGEGGGGRPWLTGRRQCNRACQNENLVSVELQIAPTLCPPRCICMKYALRKREKRTQGEERGSKMKLYRSCMYVCVCVCIYGHEMEQDH